VLLRELLSDSGSAYVHLDYNVAHYAVVLIDEVFGPDNFRNEIVWLRTTGHSDSHKWNHSHDVLFFYSRSEQYAWTGLRRGESGKPWRGIDPAERGGHWQYPVGKLDELEKEGRIYWPPAGRILRLKRYLDEMSGMPAKSIWDDISPVQGSSKERTEYATQKPEALVERIMKASSSEGDLVLDCFCGSGTTAAVGEKLNRRWIACDLGRFAIHTTRKRRLGIPGVKPFVVQNLGKYERQAWQVAEFATSPSPVILSGESASQGEARTQSKDPMPAGTQQRPGEEFSARSSVGGASGENALRGRSSLQAGKGSFDSRNRFASESVSSAQDDRVRVGAQDDRVRGSAQDDRLREQREREANYRKFILELYHATPVSGHIWLHGVKGGRMVHVAAVDAPVTRADVNAIAAEVWRAAGKGPNSPQKPAVDVLGGSSRSKSTKPQKRLRLRRAWTPPSRRSRVRCWKRKLSNKAMFTSLSWALFRWTPKSRSANWR